MATLNGQPIKDTYQGLIKTGDNAAIDATLKFLEDGVGTQLPLQVSTTGINFTGDVTGAPIDIDATNANILAKGVEALGTNNMINISPASQGIYQPFSESIAIGFNGASAGNAIFIGKFGNALFDSTVVGYNSFASTDRSGVFGNSNGIGGAITNEDKNFIFGYGNTIADQSGITNTHIIGSDITADESNVVMTNKPFKGTGYKTAGFGEVIDNNGNWTGQAINVDTGLENGSGSGSLQSATFLTSSPANASGTDSIALGSGTQAQFAAVSIGRGSNAGGTASVAIGNSANVSAQQSIGISGETCTVSGTRSIAIGRQATADSINAIAIGNFAKVTNARSMSFASCGIDINDNAAEGALMMVPGAYGCTVDGSAANSIVLGSASTQKQRATITGINGIAIGYDTIVNASNAVALGADVTASIADTVSVKELETQTVGGGIIMYSPNGTGYKLTVSDAGAPVFTAI